jgi:asparagine synthase (glutamine-hydrolysing)
VSIRRYWRPRPWVDSGADLATLERDYLTALESAVDRWAAGRGDPAVMLSGGVDSAALVSLLRRSGHRRIRTFSIHIGAADVSDREASRAIAASFQTEHRSLDDLDARCLDALPEMIWWQEAPAVEIHPTYFLARAMRDECDAVLGGYSNDILWGIAKPRWITAARMRRLFPPLNELHYLIVRHRVGRRALRRLMPGAAATDVGLLRRLARYRAATGHGLTDFVAMDAALFGDQAISRELGKTLVDAHGIWPRLPYADARVLAVVSAVPPAARLRVEGGRRVELKSFFKDVIEKHGIVPAAVVRRPKTWLTSPTAEWIRHDQRPMVEAILLGSSLRRRGIFDPRTIGELLAEHQSGRADHAYVLMLVVATEIWLRLFVDPPSLRGPQPLTSPAPPPPSQSARAATALPGAGRGPGTFRHRRTGCRPPAPPAASGTSTPAGRRSR